mgnify:CR=1 FL=1
MKYTMSSTYFNLHVCVYIIGVGIDMNQCALKNFIAHNSQLVSPISRVFAIYEHFYREDYS